MNSVIINVGLLQHILNTKYEIISIYFITRSHEQRDYRYWTNKIYFEFKMKMLSICLITRFHEHRDYRYWTIKIYFEFKK